MSEQKYTWGLGSKAKQIVLNVYNYFVNDPGNDVTVSMNHTVQSTGVSLRTVYSIRKEARSTASLASPERSQKRGPYKPVDDFDETVIRNKVHEFYTVRRQVPTIRSLHAALRENIDYPCSMTTLRKSLHKLGFKWKKTNNNRSVLIEKQSVVTQRLQFYKKKELEDLGYMMVYMDETWVDTASCSKRCWQGSNTQGLSPPINKGQRLIIVNAGCKNGFIPGDQLIYKATSNTGDYHNEMNGINFTKWIQQQLLPHLDCPCAIVMDNASYHSIQIDKCPNSGTRKADIMEWLRRHGIQFEETMLRVQLLQMAPIHRPPPSYAVDQLTREAGHEILRLPPYHPEFNAIELIWSQLKSLIRMKNVTFRMDDLQKLAVEAFGEIGPDRWERACDHVEKVIERTKSNDHVIDDYMEHFVINLADGSDSSDDSSCTDTASETE